MDLYSEILAWAEIRCQSEAARLAIYVYHGLRDRELAWEPSEGVFRSALAERFRCIAELVARFAGAKRSSGSSRLSEWLACGEQIAEHWPAVDRHDWTHLLVGLTEEGNRVAIACVSQSLWEGFRAQPGAARGYVEKLSHLDSEYWRECPVPPAPGRPLRAGCYLLAGTWGDVSCRLEEACQRWDELAGRLTGCGAGVAGLAEAEAAAAQRELRGMLELAGQGWPVDSGVVRAATKAQADSVGRAIAGLAKRSAGGERGLAALLRELRSLEALLAGDWPAEETGSAETSTSRGEGNAAAAPVPLARRILEIASELEQQSSPAAGELGRRLRDLAGLGDVGQGDRGGLKRKALSCLIVLDEMVRQSDVSEPWVRRAQARLRDCLLADGEYVLLERQLLGRPIEQCLSLADPVGFLPGGGVAQQIVRVEQPGYALRMSDGSQCVIRPAKVLLAR